MWVPQAVSVSQLLQKKKKKSPPLCADLAEALPQGQLHPISFFLDSRASQRRISHVSPDPAAGALVINSAICSLLDQLSPVCSLPSPSHLSLYFMILFSLPII